jgi:hypothetical protein
VVGYTNLRHSQYTSHVPVGGDSPPFRDRSLRPNTCLTRSFPGSNDLPSTAPGTVSLRFLSVVTRSFLSESSESESFYRGTWVRGGEE